MHALCFKQMACFSTRADEHLPLIQTILSMKNDKILAIFLTSSFSIRSFGAPVESFAVRGSGVRGGTLSNGRAWFFDDAGVKGEGYRW